MPHLRTVQDLDVQGKKVLARVDFNVPMEHETISDDTRIKAALPTIQFLLDQGASHVILMSHLGRPEGKDSSLSLKPISERLSKLLKAPVTFLSDCIGPEIESSIRSLPSGSVILLENLRFYEGEEKPKKDPEFALKLSRLGEVYINDAFGTAHRAHASTALIANYFPNKRGIGFLMEKELKALGENLTNPKRPFSAIIGGAKISTKIGVLVSLLDKVDALFIGGAMSYTFFKARGIPVGNSLVEDDMLDKAREIESHASQKGVPIYLPHDVVVVEKIAPNQPFQVVEMEQKGIPLGYEGVDIGPKTLSNWTPKIRESKTVFWNGPVGVFEVEPFDKGTCAIAQLLASMKNSAFTVVGGGDSVSALEKIGLSTFVSHVSTGGGASLEFIEKGTLPGIQALEESE